MKWVCNNSSKYTCKTWAPAAWRQNWNYYYWNCLGQNGWSTASCKIWNPQPVNGQCGLAKWNCNVGTSLKARQNWNYYEWSCGGQYGWSTASCKIWNPQPVNGQCGQYVRSCTNNGTTIWARQNWNYYERKCLGQHWWLTAYCKIWNPQYVTTCNSANVGKQNVHGQTCHIITITNDPGCINAWAKGVWSQEYKDCDGEYVCDNGRVEFYPEDELTSDFEYWKEWYGITYIYRRF